MNEKTIPGVDQEYTWSALLIVDQIGRGTDMHEADDI